jgi:alkylhydroperoxidase family enzyme
MRIEGIDINRPDFDPAIKRVLDGQARKWGAPLENQRVYARIPSIFQAAQGMWRGIAAARLLDPVLSALVNRRVAMLNGCVF